MVVTGVAGDVRMPLLVTAATTEDLFSTGDALCDDAMCDDKLFSSEKTKPMENVIIIWKLFLQLLKKQHLLDCK